MYSNSWSDKATRFDPDEQHICVSWCVFVRTAVAEVHMCALHEKSSTLHNTRNYFQSTNSFIPACNGHTNHVPPPIHYNFGGLDIVRTMRSEHFWSFFSHSSKDPEANLLFLCFSLCSFLSLFFSFFVSCCYYLLLLLFFVLIWRLLLLLLLLLDFCFVLCVLFALVGFCCCCCCFCSCFNSNEIDLLFTSFTV